jgi:hypothetical protein
VAPDELADVAPEGLAPREGDVPPAEPAAGAAEAAAAGDAVEELAPADKDVPADELAGAAAPAAAALERCAMYPALSAAESDDQLRGLPTWRRAVGGPVQSSGSYFDSPLALSATIRRLSSFLSSRWAARSRAVWLLGVTDPLLVKWVSMPSFASSARLLGSGPSKRFNPLRDHLSIIACWGVAPRALRAPPIRLRGSLWCRASCSPLAPAA